MPNSNDMSDFTCQCTDTMVATCTSSFASAYLCAAVVAIAVVLARVCTCDLSDDSDSDDEAKYYKKHNLRDDKHAPAPVKPQKKGAWGETGCTGARHISKQARRGVKNEEQDKENSDAAARQMHTAATDRNY